MSFELLPSRQRKSGRFGLPDDASKNAEIAVPAHRCLDLKGIQNQGSG
jgi:hypothetical protein